jgi:hypothetical protein
MDMHEETMLDIVRQEMIEGHYNRKHIDAKIRAHILASEPLKIKLQQGQQLVEAYMGKTYSYDSKNQRVAQLRTMDIPALVMDIFVGVAYFLREELFTSVSAQLAARLKWSDKTEAITTVAELLAVLCETDLFDINKPDKQASLTVISRIELPAQLVHFIEHSQFLPPMLCEPLPLTHNFSSGYLTHNDSLILGSGNHHDGDICLDVLNIMGKVALKLDTEFLCAVEEEPTFELDTPEKIEQWQRFKAQSYHFYGLMAKNGNRFFFNNKVDKRGRIYCHGYHISFQGSSFKKASLEFWEEEIVEGVPGLN